MGKQTKKTRNGGRWTEARFRSFIISALRAATRRWAPRNEVMKEASTRRGFKLCAGCNKEVPVSIVVKGKRVKNVFADHIEPIVDPAKGFTTWDEWIERAFVEKEGFQCLCKECHDKKTAEERKRR
jgi:hypothetical protein